MVEIKDVITIYHNGEEYICRFTRIEISRSYKQFSVQANVDYLDEVLRFVRTNFTESVVIACEIVNSLLMNEVVHYEKIY